MQESLRESENKKRTLEENIDALREEFAKMKAAGIISYFHNLINLFIKIWVNHPIVLYQ